MEVALHLEVDALKNKLVHTHDFTYQKAFKAIDDWNYGYIDESNMKRFLIGMGFSCIDPKSRSKYGKFPKKAAARKMKEVVLAIVRRFDLNGDGKVGFEEFKWGINPTPQVKQVMDKQVQREIR